MTWYTHGICHFIGLDVHDVGDYNRRLGPGMAFVIEPGLYIREQALNDLPTGWSGSRPLCREPSRRSRQS